MVSVEAEMHELAIAEEAPEPRAGAEPPASPYVAASWSCSSR